MLDPEIKDTLQDIVELGYVEIRDEKIVQTVKPIQNLLTNPWDRWTPTLQYLTDYARHHPDFGGEFFVCLYDGWREYSEPADETDRRYVPWKEVQKTNFLTTGCMKEPRFSHKNMEDTTLYPVMPLPVLTYNRHVNDSNCLLIPDAEFIENQFQSFTNQTKIYDIFWGQKKDTIFWRGSQNVNDGYTRYTHSGYGKLHQRDLVVNLSSSPEYSSYLNASFTKTSIADQLQYKYLLDIDGMVSAWSALYWKLSSRSLVWKTATHWEQWYYNQIKEYEHYIPLSSFSDTYNTFMWCKNHDHQCRDIVANANTFVKNLTYEYAVKEYKIH